MSPECGARVCWTRCRTPATGTSYLAKNRPSRCRGLPTKPKLSERARRLTIEVSASPTAPRYQPRRTGVFSKRHSSSLDEPQRLQLLPLNEDYPTRGDEPYGLSKAYGSGPPLSPGPANLNLCFIDKQHLRATSGHDLAPAPSMRAVSLCLRCPLYLGRRRRATTRIGGRTACRAMYRSLGDSVRRRSCSWWQMRMGGGAGTSGSGRMCQ